MMMTQVIFPPSVSKDFTGEKNATVQYLLTRYFKSMYYKIWWILKQICQLIWIMQTSPKKYYRMDTGPEQTSISSEHAYSKLALACTLMAAFWGFF